MKTTLLPYVRLAVGFPLVVVALMFCAERDSEREPDDSRNDANNHFRPPAWFWSLLKWGGAVVACATPLLWGVHGFPHWASCVLCFGGIAAFLLGCVFGGVE